MKNFRNAKGLSLFCRNSRLSDLPLHVIPIYFRPCGFGETLNTYVINTQNNEYGTVRTPRRNSRKLPERNYDATASDFEYELNLYENSKSYEPLSSEWDFKYHKYDNYMHYDDKVRLIRKRKRNRRIWNIIHEN